MANHDEQPVLPPFSIAMRGYDRDQVADHYRRVESEMRMVAADRDSALATSSELAQHLDAARDEIEQLRRECDRLAVPPTTAQGASDRISRMLRLASDEASELRAAAEADAAEIRSLAQQEADAADRATQEQVAAANAELESKVAAANADLDKQRQELERQRVAMAAAHEATLADAQTEAERIVTEARHRADALDAQAQAQRERTQTDFDLAMESRRADAIAKITQWENDSEADAQRKREHSHNIAIERVTGAQEAADQIRTLRSRLLTQLADVRSQLDEVPRLLAESQEEAQVSTAPIDLLNDSLSRDAQLPTTPAGSRPAPATNAAGPTTKAHTTTKAKGGAADTVDTDLADADLTDAAGDTSDTDGDLPDVERTDRHGWRVPKRTDSPSYR